MGYMRHKYTRVYFLKRDSVGNRTLFGVEGLEDFERGGIREQDADILRRIDFRGKTVLDLGFGRGEAIKYSLENGARRAVGVDFSEDAHVIAREFLAHYGLHADLHCMDALSFFKWYALQEESEQFDVCLMLDFVEHVPRFELTSVFMFMRKWLSARAVLAVNTPVFPVDNDVIADGLDPKARDTGDDFEETAGMHCNRYSQGSLRNYMRSCGFTAISGHFFVPHLSIARMLEGTPWAWWIASKRAYPIARSAMWQTEGFEYAMCWDDIRRGRSSMREESRWAIGKGPDTLLGLAFRAIKRIVLAVARRLIRRCRRNDGVKVERKPPVE